MDESKVEGATRNPAHGELARIAAEKSAVLLKNAGGVLPLKPGASKRIAVIGAFAESKADLLGSWALAATPEDTVTIVDGLKAKAGAGATVSSAPGVQMSRLIASPFDRMSKAPKPVKWSDEEAKAQFTKAIDLAREADLVVVTLGELQTMSGESASVSTLTLPGQQEQLLEAAVATGKPVVVVLVNGRPLDIRWALDHVPAVLEA